MPVTLTCRRSTEESTRSIVRHVGAMLEFQNKGAVVFDNGNLIRTQAKNGGVANSFDIPIFTEAFLRPLFARAIGPFRWIALSNDPEDIRKIDDLLLRKFGHNQIVSNWVQLARKHVPFEGLPARIAWLGHGERTELGLEVNRMVRDGELSAPIAFTRDHLDAGSPLRHGTPRNHALWISAGERHARTVSRKARHEPALARFPP